MSACFECGEAAEHDHHVVPRSRGGTKTVPLCGPCHAKAHDMDCATLAAEGKGSNGDWRATMQWDPRVDPPFGYSVDEAGRLTEAPDEQASIRRAVELRTLGHHFTEIETMMAAEGVLARGRPFTKYRVAKACNTVEGLGSGKGQTRPISPERHQQAAMLARDLHSKGYSLRRLMQALNEQAPAAHGRPWSMRQARALLPDEVRH